MDTLHSLELLIHRLIWRLFMDIDVRYLFFSAHSNRFVLYSYDQLHIIGQYFRYLCVNGGYKKEGIFRKNGRESIFLDISKYIRIEENI